MADPTAAQAPTSPSSPNTLTYYHAGPLFTLADLTTNVSLSHLISSLSSDPTQPSTSGRRLSSLTHHFQPVLPQDLEPRSLHPHSIRDSDLRALLSCDLALFVYDGAELDAGTVVEYMVAKFADIPSVILRTDFRGGGDQHQVTTTTTSAANTGKDAGEKADSWNLMSSFWPRTRTVTVDAMAVYKSALADALASTATSSNTTTTTTSTTTNSPTRAESTVAKASTLATTHLQTHTATLVLKAMEEVIRLPPRMPPHLRESVYEWLSLMVGWRDDDEGDGQGRLRVQEALKTVLGEKVGRGLV